MLDKNRGKRLEKKESPAVDANITFSRASDFINRFIYVFQMQLPEMIRPCSW